MGLLVLVMAGMGVSGYFSGLVAGHNTTEVVINTNGSNLTVQSSFLPWNPVPDAMIQEMKLKAWDDIQNPDSNLDSIKTDMQNIGSKYNFTVQTKIKSQFGDNQLPMPATVKGTSMIPTLKDGQSIVVLKTPDFKVGDIVVAHHPEYNLIVKRVGAINGSQVYLESDNHQVEVDNELTYVNGVQRQVTITKTPLNTWLPRSNVIGVVKVY